MEQINQLIEHLQTHDLVQSTSETWIDRSSDTLRVRASFENGASFTLDVSDRETIVRIRTLFQKNLMRVFARTSEFRDLLRLEVGKRYTVLVNNELGFGVSAVQITLDSIRVGRYAQYSDCINLVFKRKGARSLAGMAFYGSKSFAIFEGWVELNTDPFGPAEDQGPVIVRKMKYASCDERFMSDAIASAKVAPLFCKLRESSNNQQERIM